MKRHAHDDHRAGSGAAFAWLTVSDTRTPETDTAGQSARRLIEAAGHAIVEYAIVPDEPQRVRHEVHGWLDDARCRAVVTSGGTGISQRDTTYEALAALLDKSLDGFGELFRMLSFEQIGSAAMLSRATAGVARGKLLFLLPGSRPAVELALERLILPELGHLLAELDRP